MTLTSPFFHKNRSKLLSPLPFPFLANILLLPINLSLKELHQDSQVSIPQRFPHFHLSKIEIKVLNSSDGTRTVGSWSKW